VNSNSAVLFIGLLEDIAAHGEDCECASDLELIAAQLMAEPQLVNERIFDDITPLHTSAQLHLSKATELLLQYGGDANAVMSDGKTALHAAFDGRAEDHCAVEIATSLLSHGADPNAVTRDGDSVLYCAIRNHYPEVAALLRARGAQIDFRTAVLLGEAEIVRIQLKESTNPQALLLYPSVGLDALSATYHAPAGSHAVAVVLQLLFQYGFDPNWKDSFGYPLLLYALRYPDNPEVIETILKAGGNPNAVHPTFPESALVIAIRDNRPASASVLRAAGAVYKPK
jgi:ankyrin repeat protein